MSALPQTDSAANTHAMGLHGTYKAFRAQQRATELAAAERAATGRPGDFGTALRFFRLRACHSQNSLAKVVGINASYINRLETGEREAPTREVVMALARALTLTIEETDRLVASAGQLPPSLQKLGPDDSTVAAVVAVLTNDRLSPECRADLRAVIETICIRWEGRAPTHPDLQGGRR